MPWAFLAVAPIAWLVCLTVTAGAAGPDGAALVAERCASCHDLTGPAPRTYRGVVAREAPDLFYAGSKFNRPWLVAWLQSPTAIRRSGVTGVC